MGALLSEPITALCIDRSTASGWTAACVTMQGWRKTHEDAHIFTDQLGGTSPAGVFAILDGHGGQIAARIGAELLQQSLSRLVQEGCQPPERIGEAFLEADRVLRERLNADDKSGSTVVAALVSAVSPNEYVIQIAHAGDSRAVLCVGGQLVCSEDHKPNRPDETRRIRAAGGTVEYGALGGGPLRVDGTLAVSRSLGDFQYKPSNKRPDECKVTAVPEVTTKHCQVGDWLLLACDGIFDVVSNEEVQHFVSTRLQAEPKEGSSAPRSSPVDGGKVMTELLQLCLDRGSKDNCTACLIQFVRCEAEPRRSRELVQGPWANASTDVRPKYVDFFQMHGFEEEARAVQSTLTLPPPQRTTSSSAAGSQQSLYGGRPSTGSAGSGASSQAGARQIAAIAKALQAMRSTRAIQSAWRAHRGASGASGSGGGVT